MFRIMELQYLPSAVESWATLITSEEGLSGCLYQLIVGEEKERRTEGKGRKR